MAEAFGIAAGVAGFISLGIQVVSGIDTLREIHDRADKAQAELLSLMTELTYLGNLMDGVIKVPCNDDPALRLCYMSCEAVVRALDKLKKRVSPGTIDKGKQKALRVFALRHWKEDVEVLQQCIRSATNNLILVHTRHNTALLEEMMQKLQFHNSPLPVSISEVDSQLVAPPPPRQALDSSYESKINDRALTYCQYPKVRRHWKSAESQCSCSCHCEARISQRFWALEYTPLFVDCQTCDNSSCKVTKYGGKFSFALSQLGIRWSAAIQFHILTAPGKILFRPVLNMERIVRYTSPGFEALWKCEHGFITLEEPKNKLTELNRSDPSFKEHVNPGGRSYIEELLKRPWYHRIRPSNQCKLLELFTQEFGMTRGLQNTRFLTCCTRWTRRAGLHLELLEVLLRLGFDATIIESPWAQDWPRPPEDWQAAGQTPDPFFVEYQRMLVRDNQGFANMTPLHEAVLLGPLELVNVWIARSKPNERNLLGQTPMHLAISKIPEILALIAADHDLNSTDKYGFTPLMYAAVENREECSITLLEAGADFTIEDTRFKRNFIAFAAERGHWKLLFNCLCWIQAVAGKDDFERLSQYAIYMYCVLYPHRLENSGVSIQQLIAKCGSANFTFGQFDRFTQNNSPLHYVRSVKEIDAFLESGLTHSNHVNNSGRHALMYVIFTQHRSEVVSRLLGAGAEIDLKDHFNYTALYYALDTPGFTDRLSWASTNIVRILLANGANVLSRDKCRCPCSPGGCLPSAILKPCYHDRFFEPNLSIASLEFLSLILKHRDESEAKIVLLSFIRMVKFDVMGMTHVCCRRGSGQHFSIFTGRPPNPPMSDENIDEILDEEFEFVEILESEMAQTSTKEYGTLLDDWMLHLKASLKKACEEAVKYNKQVAMNKYTDRKYYLVDYKKDCFMWTLGSFGFERSPAKDVMSDIARHICWIEHQYHCEDSLHENVEQTLKSDWYFRRVSWLHKLVDILEIPVAEIVDRMKGTLDSAMKTECESSYKEESIKHFLKSWETWKEGRYPLVSEAEV